jgi:two-component system, NarL family, sensor kinase
MNDATLYSLADVPDWALAAELRCTHDLDGRLLSVSVTAAQALGYTVDELLKIPIRDLVVPRFHDEFDQYLDAMRRDGKAAGLMQLRTRAGSSLVWEYRSWLRDEPGAPVVASAAYDVTERVLTERALRASEDRFATAFYASPFAMAITTLDEGRYLDVNEAFERQMDYTRDEVVGHTSLELNVWPTPADRVAMVQTLLRQKRLRDRAAQFRTKSGRLITTLYSAGLITLDGRPCVLAAIADITAQKMAEDALRESEAKFRLLAETTQSGIFIYREDGTFCYFNPQVSVFTGFSAEELRSMTVWDIVHPDLRDHVRARGAARSRGENVPRRYEIKLATKSGETRWIDFTAIRIEFEGQPATMGTAFDVTINKRNEQQAKEHTALLQTLVANSPFGIMVGGKDHRIRFCNRAFQRIFQYEENEVVGQDPDDLVGLPSNDEASDISQRVLSGEVVHATGVRRRKDGRTVNVDLHAIPMMSDNEFIGCFGIYQDITERVRAEEKLTALRDRLIRVQDEERAHIARELHDNIGQRLALLTLQLAELQKAARCEAPALAEQAEASRQLTDEICQDAHRLSHRLHPSQLVFLGLARALSSLCDEFARQNRMAIEFVHEGVPRLSSDVTTCLYRVAQEAIRNAERHSGCRRVHVELLGRPGSVRLCVSDAGRGFDRTAEAGAGLGLVSMAERVRSVGGLLSVSSEIDRGTRIEVSIPLPARAGAESVQSADPTVSR